MNKIRLKISGKNIERFIKRLSTNNIDLLKITYLNKDVYITIYKKDYEKLISLKTIYDVNIVENYGIMKLEQIKRYKYIIISSVICLFLIIFLSNIIFNVEVVYNDINIRKLITNELETYGISKYKFKKSFEEIQIIKENIKQKYKDKIEWLEIEEYGTKYIVRLEPRLIIDNKLDDTKQNVVAKKDAIIKDIIAKNGQIIKEINTYVKKDEVIISGNIYLNDVLKESVKAIGEVYGEVWYNVSVSYPYIYSEIKETGNYKENYTLKIFDKRIELDLSKFKEKRIKENIVLKHSFLPIFLVKENQSEIETISEVLTYEEAIDKAIQTAINKMDDNLNDKEKIIDYKILNTKVNNDKVVVDIFFTVYENITSYKTIEGDVYVP